MYDPETKQYWDDAGALGVIGKGWEINYGTAVFASERSVDVENWISGVKACKAMMNKR